MIHIGDCQKYDPFKAWQAKMVFYMNDEVNKDWSVVVHLKPRDLYVMGEQKDIEVCKTEPYLQQDLNQFFSDFDDLPLVRDDVDEELLNEEYLNDEVEEISICQISKIFMVEV